MIYINTFNKEILFNFVKINETKSFITMLIIKEAGLIKDFETLLKINRIPSSLL